MIVRCGRELAAQEQAGDDTHAGGSARQLFAFLALAEPPGIAGRGFVREAIDRLIDSLPGCSMELDGDHATISAAGAVISLDCRPFQFRSPAGTLCRARAAIRYSVQSCPEWPALRAQLAALAAAHDAWFSPARGAA